MSDQDRKIRRNHTSGLHYLSHYPTLFSARMTAILCLMSLLVLVPFCIIWTPACVLPPLEPPFASFQYLLELPRLSNKISDGSLLRAK
jgi:hypothetical protein